jgi:endonuclease YncB( thermonuclease family)
MLSQLADGQTLACEQTGTSYSRVVAICRNEANIEINCAMVESGTALIWPKYNAQRALCGP